MILLLGGSGYIGTAFRECMDRRGIAYESVSRAQCSYYEPRQLNKIIRQIAPEFLINAAGFTGVPNVDACEQQKSECLFGNVILPTVIRDVCQHRGLPWGHVSSGCIYSGSGPSDRGYGEDDAPNFTFEQGHCSFYSGCKALAEKVLEDAANCYVWRLRIPFGPVDSSRNYLSKLMRYDRLLDARNSLTDIDEFAGACLDCWSQRVDFGTYNLTNPGSITTREITDMIWRSGHCRKHFDFFVSEEEFMATAALSPRSSCVLDTRKAQRASLSLSHVSEAIERALQEWQWCAGQHRQYALQASECRPPAIG